MAIFEGYNVMKIYIAARFSKRHEANKLANFLQDLGHTITSRWVRPECDHVMPTGLSEQAEDSERQRYAMEDIEDVNNCDWMISLMEEPRNNSRGGRHIEFGYALALRKKLTIIGKRETVFHHLDEVIQFESIEQFLIHIHENPFGDDNHD
jgi:nucleoside 2-deoxyribosyltransferase